MKKLLRIVLSSLFALALLSIWMAVPTFAQEAVAAASKPPTWLERLTNDVLVILVPAVTLVITTYVAKLLNAAAKKLHMDVPPKAQQELDALVDKGIHYAAEQARKVSKSAGGKMSQEDAKAHAVNYVLDMAESKKIVEMGRDKLGKYIEAKLNIKRHEVELQQAVTEQAEAHAINLAGEKTLTPDGISK
jgi:hypothetical protein